MACLHMDNLRSAGRVVLSDGWQGGRVVVLGLVVRCLRVPDRGHRYAVHGGRYIKTS